MSARTRSRSASTSGRRWRARHLRGDRAMTIKARHLPAILDSLVEAIAPVVRDFVTEQLVALQSEMQKPAQRQGGANEAISATTPVAFRTRGRQPPCRR